MTEHTQRGIIKRRTSPKILFKVTQVMNTLQSWEQKPTMRRNEKETVGHESCRRVLDDVSGRRLRKMFILL